MTETNSFSQTGTHLRTALLILWAVVFLRLAANLASPLNLYADEAQYWRWGQTLEWGYYSKPPLIAWVLHFSTALFGDSEKVVRLAAPLLHGAAATFLFLLGRRMADVRLGLLAGLTYLLMPAVSLSSAVISTDGVLMPFWCAGLWGLWQLRAGERGFAPALILGSAIGLGLLAKYAMLYFLIGLAFAALIDRPTRQAIVSRQGLIAGLIGAALFAPHVLWNMANDFKTVSHTVDNANLGGDLFNPENFLTFLTDQAGVFGPVAFLTLLIGLFVMRTGTPDGKSVDRWLLCFILPVLVFILAQSVISRANANWAATAYPAASILVVRWLRRAAPNARLWQIVSGLTFLAMLAIPDLSWPVKIIMAALIGGGLFGLGHVMKQRPAGLIGAGLVLNGMLALLFVVLMVLPPAATSALGFDNAVKRAKGWKEIALQVMATAEAEGASAVLVDEREVWHAFDYYARERTIPMISWRRYPGPKSFSETVPLQGALARRVLVASYHEDLRPHLRSDFQRFDYIGKVQVDLGRRSNGCRIKRTIALYIAEGHAPPPRTPEWEARFVGQREYAEPACVK